MSIGEILLLSYWSICTIIENIIEVKDHAERNKEDATLVDHIGYILPSMMFGWFLIPIRLLERVKTFKTKKQEIEKL